MLATNFASTRGCVGGGCVRRPSNIPRAQRDRWLMKLTQALRHVREGERDGLVLHDPPRVASSST